MDYNEKLNLTDKKIGDTIKVGEIQSDLKTLLNNDKFLNSKVNESFARGGGNGSSGIVQGLNVVIDHTRQCLIGTGEAIIGKKLVKNDAEKLFTLPVKTTGLLLLDANNNVSIKSATYPEVDENTICHYTFNYKKNDVALIDNGPNKLDATIYGGVFAIPGLDGKNGIQFDGISGYAQTTDPLPLPTQGKEKSLDIIFELVRRPSANAFICSLVGTTTNQNFCFFINSAGVLYTEFHSSTYSTEITILPNKLYHASIVYKDEWIYVYVNGQLTNRINIVLNTLDTLKLRFGAYYGTAAANFSPVNLYYLEYRKKARSKKEVLNISNNVFIPVTYEERTRSYPIQHKLLKEGTLYDEYVLDSLNFKNTGNRPDKTDPVMIGQLELTDSDFGKTPYFKNNANNYYNCGKITFDENTGWTLIAIVKPNNDHVANKRFAGTSTIFGISEGADNNFGVYQGAWYSTDSTNTMIPYDYNFCVAKYEKSLLELSINNYKTTTFHNVTLATKNEEFSIGLAKKHDNNNPWMGEIPYIAVFNRALTEAEIKEIYDQYVFQYVNKYNIESTLGKDYISLGYFKTNGENIEKYDFNNRRYGRKEIGNNHISQTGWFYATLNQISTFENLLGSENIQYEIYANTLEPSFNNAERIDGIYSAGAYGTWLANVTGENFKIYTGDKAIAWAYKHQYATAYLNVLYWLSGENNSYSQYDPVSVSNGLSTRIDQFFQHDHTDNAASKINTKAISDYAITTNKIANESITNIKIAEQAVGTSKIANRSVTEEKISETLVDNIVNKINNQILSGKDVPIDKHTDGIISGLKASRTNNIINISAGSYRHNGIVNTLSSDISIVLEENKSGHIEMIPNQDGGELIFEVKYDENNKIKSPYPIPNENFCFQYTFDSRGEDNATLIDHSSNARNMKINGGIQFVTDTDEIFPTAYKTDGSTGFLNSANTANLPAGKETWELNIVFKINRKNVEQHILRFGNQNLGGISVYLNSANKLLLHGATATEYEILAGKLYWLTIQYDGYWLIYRIDGEEMFRQQNVTYNISQNTAAGYDFRIGSWIAAGIVYPTGMYYYYVDLRKNIVRTTSEIQKEMFDCGYLTGYLDPNIELPSSRKNKVIHEYHFNNDDIDTVVKDSIGSLDLTAVDITSANLQYHYTNTRRKNGKHILIKEVSNQWFKSSDNFRFPDEFTIVAQYLPYSLSGYPAIVSNITNANPSGVALLCSNNGDKKPTMYINKVGYMSSNTIVEEKMMCTVIATLKNKVLSFYVNNPDIPSASYILDYNESWEKPLQIGAWNNNDYRLKAELYYLKITDYGFTKQEVKEHFVKLAEASTIFADSNAEQNEDMLNNIKILKFDTMLQQFEFIQLDDATDWSTKDFIWQGTCEPTDPLIRFWLTGNVLKVRTVAGWRGIGAVYS